MNWVNSENRRALGASEEEGGTLITAENAGDGRIYGLRQHRGKAWRAEHQPGQRSQRRQRFEFQFASMDNGIDLDALANDPFIVRL